MKTNIKTEMQIIRSCGIDIKMVKSFLKNISSINRDWLFNFNLQFVENIEVQNKRNTSLVVN